jgi:lysophospholipase L1-like esterase
LAFRAFSYLFPAQRLRLVVLWGRKRTNYLGNLWLLVLSGTLRLQFNPVGGPAFSKRFNERVKIINYAKNGATLQALSQRLDELMELNPDYVLIQFGHNDQKRYDPSVYSDRLRSYVERIKKSGGKAVIVSSVTRRSFNEDGKIVSNLLKNEKYSYKATLTDYAKGRRSVSQGIKPAIHRPAPSQYCPS